MRSFKICHIGCGGMSLRGHGPALAEYVKEYPGVALAGCCDLDIDKAIQFSALFGFEKAYTDWELMLNDVRPDAVSLVVPVSLTAELAISILKKGYDIITEKPPGMTQEQCMAIILAQKASGKKATAAFNRRYMPLVKELKVSISGKTLTHIRYDFFRSGRKDADFSTTAIHGIDTVRMLAGCDYKEMDIAYQTLESTPVGNIFMTGTMENKATFAINLYPDSGFTAERATIISEDETYFLNIPVWGCHDHPGSILHFKNGSLVENIDGVDSEQFILNGFYDEHRDFYEAIRNGTPVPHEIIDSLQSVEIMELIRHRKKSL